MMGPYYNTLCKFYVELTIHKRKMKISFDIYDSNYSRDKIHTVRASNINRVACSLGQQPGRRVGAG